MHIADSLTDNLVEVCRKRRQTKGATDKLEMTLSSVQPRYCEGSQRAALGGDAKLMKALTEICSGRIPASRGVDYTGSVLSFSVLENITATGCDLMKTEF